MKTISVNIYSFNELSKEAKQVAISNYRDSNLDTSFIYNEAYATVKEFNKLFNTKEGCDSWLDIRHGHIDDSILKLKGLRLRKYILNNFYDSLFKNKYIKQVNKNPVYSKINKDNCCVLTGVCYDQDILDPIYNFLKLKDFDNTTFEDLLEDCMKSLGKSIRSEEEAMNEDDYIIDEINSNDYEFYENGKLV